jgi:hypothetical protein
MILKNESKFLHQSESKTKHFPDCTEIVCILDTSSAINAKGLQLLPASPKSSVFSFRQALQIPLNSSAGADSEFSNLRLRSCDGVIVIYRNGFVLRMAKWLDGY